MRPVPWELLGPNGMAAHRGATALGSVRRPVAAQHPRLSRLRTMRVRMSDARQTGDARLLSPARPASGAVVSARCKVDRIDIEDGRAVGVRASLLDGSGRRAGKLLVKALDVIVCCRGDPQPGPA